MSRFLDSSRTSRSPRDVSRVARDALRNSARSLVAVVALALLTLAGCGQSASLPKAGETLQPKLSQPLRLVAGKGAQIYVRLQAISSQGDARELTGFDAYQGHHPQADLVFFDAEGEEIQRCSVALETRC